MVTFKKYARFVLFGGITVAMIVGYYFAYTERSCLDTVMLVKDSLAGWYYVDTPVDCPPCDEGIKYEWFYVEPPLHNHLPEEEEKPTENEKGGDDMGP